VNTCGGGGLPYLIFTKHTVLSDILRLYNSNSVYSLGGGEEPHSLTAESASKTTVINGGGGSPQELTVNNDSIAQTVDLSRFSGDSLDTYILTETRKKSTCIFMFRKKFKFTYRTCLFSISWEDPNTMRNRNNQW